MPAASSWSARATSIRIRPASQAGPGVRSRTLSNALVSGWKPPLSGGNDVTSSRVSGVVRDGGVGSWCRVERCDRRPARTCVKTLLRDTPPHEPRIPPQVRHHESGARARLVQIDPRALRLLVSRVRGNRSAVSWRTFWILDPARTDRPRLSKMASDATRGSMREHNWNTCRRRGLGTSVQFSALQRSEATAPIPEKKIHVY